MPVNPANVWSENYKATLDKVFKDAAKEGFDAKTAIQKSYQKWHGDNAKGVQCIAPLTTPVTLSATTQDEAFAPVDFTGCKSAEESAQVLASAWQSWASAITWVPPPPAPPFSAIASVVVDPSSVAAAYAIVLKDLIVEYKNVPTKETVDKKYETLGKIFSSAIMSVKVMFAGSSMSSPPTPLTISVPVF